MDDQYEDILLPEGPRDLHTTFEFCIGADRTIRKARVLNSDSSIAVYSILSMLDLSDAIRFSSNGEVMIQIWNRDTVKDYGPFVYLFDGFKPFFESKNFLWLQQRRLEILTNNNQPLEVR